VRLTVLLLALSAWAAIAQPIDPLEAAYRALRANLYDEAVRAFHQAIVAAPDRASVRKDLAYTLLKIGENEAARAQFAEAMRLDPADAQAALEYAFLCHETKLRAEARRVFDRLRKAGNSTAEQAFQNIDQPLAEGIARWKRALELSPDNFSAHQELARVAEERDELTLAAEHYEKAWRLRPAERSLLLDLGRVWKRMGRAEDASFALIAASRGAQPRVAEAARELLPARYPYVYNLRKRWISTRTMPICAVNWPIYCSRWAKSSQPRGSSRSSIRKRRTTCFPRLNSASCVSAGATSWVRSRCSTRS